jgi:hypothetical protein
MWGLWDNVFDAGQNPMTTEKIIRAAAIEMLRSGLATQAEVAVLARTSRQRIQYWAQVEKNLSRRHEKGLAEKGVARGYPANLTFQLAGRGIVFSVRNIRVISMCCARILKSYMRLGAHGKERKAPQQSLFDNRFFAIIDYLVVGPSRIRAGPPTPRLGRRHCRTS